MQFYDRIIQEKWQIHIDIKTGLCRFDRVPQVARILEKLYAIEAFVDRAEGIANDRTEDHQGRDNDNGY